MSSIKRPILKIPSEGKLEAQHKNREKTLLFGRKRLKGGWALGKLTDCEGSHLPGPLRKACISATASKPLHSFAALPPGSAPQSSFRIPKMLIPYLQKERQARVSKKGEHGLPSPSLALSPPAAALAFGAPCKTQPPIPSGVEEQEAEGFRLKKNLS